VEVGLSPLDETGAHLPTRDYVKKRESSIENITEFCTIFTIKHQK
jgi:hypothetical protein